MPLCLEIAADIARRSRELARFPPVSLLSILDGNEVEVAHFLLACTINQTIASSNFQINARICEAAITDGGRILDTVLLRCCFAPSAFVKRFSERTLFLRILLWRMSLVLERKV
jgi:hypothetical protein